MIDALHEKARGRWREILTGFGVDEKHLGTNKPCARCGGRDRASFSDTDGKGTFYCRACGPYDGLDLLQDLRGWELRRTVAEVEKVLGVLPDTPKRERKKSDPAKALNAAFKGSKPVYPNCLVHEYLKARGLSVLPPALRYHPNLELGRASYPAMLGMILNVEGKAVGIHRTYLEGDHKAPIDSPKRYLTKEPLQGSAIRLWPATEAVALAEGIESAAAASILSGLPAWACMDALRLEQVELPQTIKRVVVWADNDATTEYAGQAAAYALAKRLTREGRKVTVNISPVPGYDALDELLLRQRAKQ